MDGQIGSDRSLDVQQELVEVQQELVKHAERQTQLLQQIADRLRFFYVFTLVGLSLLALYTVMVVLWSRFSA